MASRAQRRVERWYEHLSIWRAMGTVVGVAVMLVLIAGLLQRLVEPETFTSIGLAYWWAIETVSTVGYGDIVPTSPAGRTVASVLMLTGLALIPILTSLIVTALVARRRQSDQERIEQLEREQGVILERIEKRLERLEQRQ